MIISSRFKNDGKPAFDLSPIQIRSKERIMKKLEMSCFKKEKVECIICGKVDFELLSEQYL